MQELVQLTPLKRAPRLMRRPCQLADIFVFELVKSSCYKEHLKPTPRAEKMSQSQRKHSLLLRFERQSHYNHLCTWECLYQDSSKDRMHKYQIDHLLD